MNLIAALALLCQAYGGVPVQDGSVLHCYTFVPQPPFTTVEMR